jgi:hypothetical protein
MAVAAGLGVLLWGFVALPIGDNDEQPTDNAASSINTAEGVTFNHFVGIQQSLTTPTPEVIFTATVRGSVEEGDLYWKMIALEEFDGTHRFPAASVSSRPLETGQWEIADQAFIGPVAEVTSTVTIDHLRETYLPLPY